MVIFKMYHLLFYIYLLQIQICLFSKDYINLLAEVISLSKQLQLCLLSLYKSGIKIESKWKNSLKLLASTALGKGWKREAIQRITTIITNELNTEPSFFVSSLHEFKI